MKKNIIPKDDKGRYHGDCVIYFDRDKIYKKRLLWHKGSYVHGKRHGYFIFYFPNGNLSSKCYYVNGVELGYCEIYDYITGNLSIKKYII